jgi:hypothetical protein
LSVSLTLSKAFAMFTFVRGGSHMPVEKDRDETAGLIILQYAAKYCLNPAPVKKIMESDREERSVYIVSANA